MVGFCFGFRFRVAVGKSNKPEQAQHRLQIPCKLNENEINKRFKLNIKNINKN